VCCAGIPEEAAIVSVLEYPSCSARIVFTNWCSAGQIRTRIRSSRGEVHWFFLVCTDRWSGSQQKVFSYRKTVRVRQTVGRPRRPETTVAEKHVQEFAVRNSQSTWQPGVGRNVFSKLGAKSTALFRKFCILFGFEAGVFQDSWEPENSLLFVVCFDQSRCCWASGRLVLRPLR
jgi:hypothetical protein